VRFVHDEAPTRGSAECPRGPTGPSRSGSEGTKNVAVHIQRGFKSVQTVHKQATRASKKLLAKANKVIEDAANGKKPRQRQLRYDAWTITQNNPQRDWDFTADPRVSYAVWQLELAPTTGTPHYQGYIQTSTLTTRDNIKDIIGEADIRKSNGSDEDNYNYCTKPNEVHPKADPPIAGPYEYGRRAPRAGKAGGRTDIMVVKRLLDETKSISAVADQHFGVFLHSHRGLQEYLNTTVQPRSRDTHGDMEVIWIFGPSSKGKTTRAIEEAGADPIYFTAQPKADGIRWNGYEFQRVVILDDYTGRSMSWTHLMRMLQPIPWRAPTDGGSVEFVAHKIIFTSILHPALVYKDHLHKLGRDWTELQRRISRLIYLHEVHHEGLRGGQHPGPDAEQFQPEYYQHSPAHHSE